MDRIWAEREKKFQLVKNKQDGPRSAGWREHMERRRSTERAYSRRAGDGLPACGRRGGVL
ncbi:GRB10 interacting GYF protein 2 [Homo sapiens]|uniref:GRB10 interacting GYF protein 2 n=3 Tax=Simiiformes TaxID=314293 RepID=F8WBF1_HUMAN|nr:GRB10 interacting GYF protein 2 [Homo sapiens]KAI4038645.1 GRB10 interacting GYF protein 2 [Homo sapiens]